MNIYLKVSKYIFTKNDNGLLIISITLYFIAGNRLYLKGTPGPNNLTYGGDLRSPFFPAPYPKDLGAEYVISCQQTELRCRVKLLFTYFMVSTQSIIEVRHN